jgi:hypothetical protein
VDYGHLKIDRGGLVSMLGILGWCFLFPRYRPDDAFWGSAERALSPTPSNNKTVKEEQQVHLTDGWMNSSWSLFCRVRWRLAGL